MTGFALEKACSQPGMLAVFTNAPLVKVSGKISDEAEELDLLRGGHEHADPDREPGEGERDDQDQAQAGEDGERVGARAEAHDRGDRVEQGERPGLLGQVGDDAAGQRGEPGDRQRPQAAEEALVQVGGEPGGGVQGGEQRVLDHDAGQQVLQVGVRRAADRAAEDVDEQQQEHDRLDAEVDQLERVVLDLHQRAPGERAGLLDAAEGADAGGS